MSIFQFLRIFWARRWLVLGATVACFLGAFVVANIIPPQWQATSRILMGRLHPDPVTGLYGGAALYGGKGATRGYVSTQVALITDYTVLGSAVDQLGMLSNPRLIAAYQRRPKTNTMDFRHWLAQRIGSRTTVTPLPGSGILEIAYTDNNPEQAKLVANTLAKAYIDTSLAFLREDANKNADWYQGQADANSTGLDAAEAALADFERKNGVMMADQNTDLDSARLKALAAGPGAEHDASQAIHGTPKEYQLAQLDAKISQVSKILGPNHPELEGLRASREALAKEVAREKSAAGLSASSSTSATASYDAAVQAAKNRVWADSAKLTRLKQLQNEVNIRRDMYQKSTQKVAELREQAEQADTGLTTLGSATTSSAPTFPNMPLIIVGSIGLGMATGLFAALLAELFNRRVRGVEDLKELPNTPVIAVIAPPPRGVGLTRTARRRRTGRTPETGRGKAARA